MYEIGDETRSREQICELKAAKPKTERAETLDTTLDRKISEVQFF